MKVRREQPDRLKAAEVLGKPEHDKPIEFDAESAIPPELWDDIFAEIEQTNNPGFCLHQVKLMKALRPEMQIDIDFVDRFPDHKRWFLARLMGDVLRYYSDIATLKQVDPELFGKINEVEQHWGKLEATMRNKKEEDDYPHVARGRVSMAVLFPDRLEELQFDDEEWEQMKEKIASVFAERDYLQIYIEMNLLLAASILRPDRLNELDLRQLFNELQRQLQEIVDEDELSRVLPALMAMQVLASDKVVLRDDGNFEFIKETQLDTGQPMPERPAV